MRKIAKKVYKNYCIIVKNGLKCTYKCHKVAHRGNKVAFFNVKWHIMKRKEVIPCLAVSLNIA